MDVRHRLATIAGKLMRPIRAGERSLAISELRAKPLHVHAMDFTDGARIPERHTGTSGIEPELSWEHPPEGTKEVVLLCEDPDAPLPKPFTHWIVHGISPETTAYATEARAEWSSGVRGRSGRNSSGKVGFVGPMPPPGHGVHHYHFEVFALDAPLALPANPDRDRLVNAMRGHVIASGETVGTYEAR